MSTRDRLATALDGRYRVDAELGAGGMATVFRAQDLKHDRVVAIKVLRPELAYAVGSDRFLREIATTAALRHPHILPLYDSGDADGLLYYVMPFVDGETLRDRLRRDGRLPVALALQFAREIADALGYAHERGIAHRDIKPENILLERGHAVVADFGIARAVAATGSERLTQTGFAVGTPLYMSPEQAVGDTNVDGRSDLYSLGCVLYEMLAGEPPFTGETVAQITQQHLIGAVPRLSAVRPEVSPGVDAAITQALAKDPSARPWPAAQFVDTFEATTSQPSAPLPRPSTRGHARRLVGMVAAAAILLGGAAAWWKSRTRTLAAPAAPGTPIGRIAVIPMDNQTGDTAQRFFADGMTREVIGVLADAGVRVLGYRAVAPYRNSTKPIRELANELGVDAIVSGAVLRGGEVVSLSAELIDARSDETLWSRTFERPARDVVTLQREVAREIARGIRAGLTPDQTRRLAAARQVDPRAYAQYLLGQEAAALRTADGLRKAVDHLSRSLAMDSTYAPAWAGLAIAHAYALIYQTAPRDSAYRTTMRAADRALTLDPDLGDAFYARGVARLHDRWEFADAFADFAAADARPSSSLGVGMAVWAMWESGDSTAISRARRLVDQEPTTAQWRSDLAWGLWSSNRAAEAVQSARTGIASDTTFYEIFDILSLALAGQGQHAAADSAHRRAVRVAGGDYWVRLVNEGFLASYRGDTAGVRRALKALDGDPRLAQRASLLLLLGERDAAYAMFDRAVTARDLDLLQMLNGMPPLFRFRQEPRYQALLARIGIPERLRD
ncbi:MAG: protein kinase [Gemmatimonadaceae bacterium]|nr:protein kinase [Gemmatimonadaceae bacterium]